jgi:hypothetical protein
MILNLSLTLGFALFSANSPALAQTPALDQLIPGYRPTVFTSKDQVQKLFDDMPWTFREKKFFGIDQGSQCYMRAHIWTYDFDRNQNVKAMKAFVFYTHAYKEWYKKKYKTKFDWWFHVTPYTLLKNPETQQLEEWTLDATFSDEILPMKPWTDKFVYSQRPCKEFVPYSKFKCEVTGLDRDDPTACTETIMGTEHCYLVRMPATIYEPSDIEAYEAGQGNGLRWDYTQVAESLDKAPTEKSKKFWKKRLGF